MNALRRALLCAACALVAAAPARSQEGAAPLPAGAGTLRGRIVRDGPGEIAGLPVVLYAVPKEGPPGLGRTVSDADGAFAFEGISNAPEVSYLVGVRADDLPYGTRASFAAGESEHAVEIEVKSPSTDASEVRSGGSHLRIDRGCGGLRLIEVHELHNPGPRAVFVPPAQRAQAKPLLELELPEGAGPISVPFGAQGLVQEGRRVAFWGPLQPGSQEVEVGYSVPADRANELAWKPPAGAKELEILTDAASPRPRGAGLRAGGEREIDGHRYAVTSAGPLAPDEPVRLSLEIPEAPETRVSITEAQTWLELDDAALVVDASYRLATPGPEPMVASTDAPLLCLSLPPGASGLRFSQSTLAMGAEPDPSGELALRGPIPPGSSVVAIRYRIPVEGDSVALPQTFPTQVPLWSVLVADTGVAVETARLHRRRPMQSDDRSYLHLEAFELEPGERVDLELRRLPAHRALPRLAEAGFSLALAAAGVAFLVAPLRSRREEEIPDAGAAAFETERDSIRAALAGLEEDYETGKVAESDYAELRAELRARLAELLEQRDAARRVAGAAPPVAPRCAGCSADLPPDARFCHRCGQAVAAGARAREAR